MKRSGIAVLLCLAAACGARGDALAALKDSLESIGNEMMAMHEPRRVVEYHDRSGQPFWIAVIPARTPQQALTEWGIPLEDRCPSSDLTTIAVGGGEPVRCVTLDRRAGAELRAAHKSAGATARLTLILDAHGYRIVDVK